MSRFIRNAFVLATLALLALPASAFASHFRGATITWTRSSGTSTTANFVVTHSWRVSPSVNLIYSSGGSSGGLSSQSLGSFTDSTGSTYTAYRSTTSRNFGTSTGSRTAYFSSCCRISNLQDGWNDEYFRVESVINFSGGNTASPAIGAPALLQMVPGAQNSVSMAVVDPDQNESATCTWATAGQAVGASYPPGTNSSTIFKPSWLNLDSQNCILSTNAGFSASAPSLWAYAVRVTDAYGAVTTFDGMIEMVSGTPPTCSGGGNFNTSVGVPFSTTFTGTNPTGGNLTMQVTGQPSGSTFSLTSGSSPVTSTFNWTPTSSDFGQTYAASVIVSNSQNLQATCPLGLTVPLNQPPQVTTTGPYTGVNGQPTAVNASATDPDGQITTYEWDCNNDGVYEIGPNPTGAATCPGITTSGTYPINVRVTDDAGGQTVVQTTITIPSLPPVANAGGPYAGNIGIPVSLTGNGSSDPDGAIALYEWDCTSDGTYDMSTTVVNGGLCTYNASGTYTVTLRVSDNEGSTDTDTATVNINVDPIADAGGPYTPNVGTAQPMNGSGSVDPNGNIVLYEWDCTNDGTYDVVSVGAQNAQCTWATPGLYTARLRVTDNGGAQDEDTANVTVNGPPVADAGGPYILANTFTANVDGSGSFDSDGTIVLYEWDCDSDGTLDLVGAAATGACTYPGAGNYTVTLTVTDNQGLTATSSDSVSVQNSGPVADAGGPYNVGQGVIFALDASGSSDPDGTIVSYEWDCDNNGTYEFSNPSPTATNCSIADEGTYQVNLRVTDNNGDQATDSAVVNVSNSAPVAIADNITGGPYFGTKNFPIQVNGSASYDPDGTLVSYEWDCESDGVIDEVSTQSVGNTCTFAAVGTYTVTLQVTDDDGVSDTDTATIIVGNDSPTADVGGPYVGVEGVPVPLDASASADPGGMIVQYDYDCDTDGTIDVTVTSPTAGACTYDDQGTYTITLVVTDDDGLTDSISTTVDITNVNPVLGNVSVPDGDEGAAIAFSATATDTAGDPLTYNWDFGDGNTGSGDTVSHTYADDGTYTVVLTVLDGDGGSATQTETTVVANVNPSFLSTVPTLLGDEGESLSFDVTVDDQGPADVPDLVVTWDWGDGSATETGTSMTHAFPDDDTYFVTATVDDQDGGTDSVIFEVVTANVAPIITSSPPVNAVQGTLYSYQPIVDDPGTEVFSWTMSPSAPSGMTIDPSTGLIEWTPTASDLAQGSFTVVITVDDGDGGSDAQSWTIQVFFADSDGDGLPDDWETDNGLDPNDPNDAGQDPDFDGATNLDEFGQGTDPFQYDGPGLPVLVSPIGGTIVDSDRPDLLIDNATDPNGDILTYAFEVYSDAALGNLVTSVSGVTEGGTQSEWKVDVPLMENTDYWWRAAAEDMFTTGPWTADETFFVNAINETPGLPTLVYPIDGETADSTTPNLLWTEAEDVDRDQLTYDVEIFDANGDLYTSATGIGGDGVEANWTVETALIENEWYTWTVRAVDPGGLMSEWVEPESFFVSADNQAPIGTAFIYPIDGIEIENVSPTLIASEAVDPEGTAVLYQFEIDRDSTFTSAEYDTLTVPHNGSGEVEWVLADFGIEFAEDAWAFARVRAIDEDGIASAPDTITFYVRGGNGAPSVPVLYAPDNGAEGPARPTLVVEDPTDPEGDVVFIEYIVAAEQDLENVITNFEDGVLSGQNEDLLTRWDVDVDLEGEVFWTARAVDEHGAASDWAEPWRYRAPGYGIDDGTGDGVTGGSGCDCASSVSGESSNTAWLLLLLPLAGLARRRR